MNSPGFTAPISLAGRASVSRSTQPREPRSAVVVPTRWSWLNVWDGALAWMVERPGELAPSSENCELACGADRGACFRAGGTREICDHVANACLLHCFFVSGDPPPPPPDWF